MKDKKPFRLITIGFLSGIVFSGFVFLTINSLQNHQGQINTLSLITPVLIENPIGFSTQTNEKLNINLATFNQLVSLPGIGETKANAIIDFRNNYGDFENISDLTYVVGIGNTLLKTLEDLVIIN